MMFVLLEEAALRLGQDREFITRLVEWCAVEEHPGVKGQLMKKLSNCFIHVDMFLCIGDLKQVVI